MAGERQQSAGDRFRADLLRLLESYYDESGVIVISLEAEWSQARTSLSRHFVLRDVSVAAKVCGDSL